VCFAAQHVGGDITGLFLFGWGLREAYWFPSLRICDSVECFHKQVHHAQIPALATVTDLAGEHVHLGSFPANCTG
jgi:hypothetical protein